MSHHHHSDYVDVVSAQGPTRLSSKMRVIYICMMIVGLIAFLLAIFSDKPRMGWIAFLHNLYFFTGLSAGGAAIAAIVHVARAFWGRPVKRFSEAMGAFLPFTLVGIVILWIGSYLTPGEHFLYEWLYQAPDPELYHNKAFWLQQDFFFGRQFVAILVLYLIYRQFQKASLRPDLGLAASKNPDAWSEPSGWQGLEAEVEASQNRQTRWGVVYCFAYAGLISLFAFDFIMSLDFRWISTMFGGWAFTSCLLQAWGFMMWIAWFMGDRFGVQKYMHPKLYHDLGKLTFGFTIVWAYLFFAQLNVIWYGNLAHETGFLITRFTEEPWMVFGWISAILVFVLPFFIGLSKKLKMSPKTFTPVLIISFIGLWIERFTLIAPSCWYFDRHTDDAGEVIGYLGGINTTLFVSAVVFLGFFGLFALVFSSYLYKRPVMVISDPRLDEGINRH